MEIRAPGDPIVNVHKVQSNSLSNRTKNAAFVIAGFCKKAGRRGRIQSLKQKVKQRKSIFGVEYMDLYETGADNLTLDRCVQKARMDINSLLEGIAHLRDEVASIEAETQSKIMRRDDQAYTTPSLTVSESIDQRESLYPAQVRCKESLPL